MRKELLRRNSGGPAVLVGTLATCRPARGRSWATVALAGSRATDQLSNTRDENVSVRASHANCAADEQHDMRVSDVGSCEPPLCGHAAVTASPTPGSIDGHVSNPTSTRTILPAVTEVVMPLRRSGDAPCMETRISSPS